MLYYLYTAKFEATFSEFATIVTGFVLPHLSYAAVGTFSTSSSLLLRCVSSA